jgi:hypothetical protein
MNFIFTLSFIMSYTINNKIVVIPAGTIFASAAHTTDPSGYVIADGIERTDGSDGRYNNLIDLTIGLGTLTKNAASYTPINLKAAFLRSAGSQTITNSYTGPTIKNYQHTAIEKHSHTGSSEAHKHSTSSTAANAYDNTAGRIGMATVNGYSTEVGDNSNQDNEINVFNIYDIVFVQADAQDGYTNITGNDSNETAPFCYGVNWLIKL